MWGNKRKKRETSVSAAKVGFWQSKGLCYQLTLKWKLYVCMRVYFQERDMHEYIKMKLLPAIRHSLTMYTSSAFSFSLWCLFIVWCHCNSYKRSRYYIVFIRTLSRTMTLKCVRKHQQANDHEDVISLYWRSSLVEQRVTVCMWDVCAVL